MANNTTLDLANIDQQLQSAVTQVSAAGGAVLEILPHVQEQQAVLADEVNKQMTLLEGQAGVSFENVMEINEQAIAATASPLNQILGPEVVDLLASIGIVDENKSITRLSQKAQREQLKLKHIEQQATTLNNRAQRLQQQIQAPLANALQGIKVSQDVLAAQQQAFQTRSALVAKRVAEVNQAVEGATLQELQAAIKSGDPTKIHPDARLGDLSNAVMKKSTAMVNFQQAQLAAQRAGVELTSANLKLLQDMKTEFLNTQDASFLAAHLPQAQAAEKAGTPYKIGDIPVTSRELSAAYTKASLEQKKNLEDLTAQGMQMFAVEEKAAQTSAELTRVISTQTNTSIPLPSDIRAIDVKTLPGNMQAVVAEAQALLAVADSQPEGIARQVALAEYEKKAAEITSNLVKKTTENLPKSQQAAHQQFYTTGQIADRAVAADYLSENLLTTPILRTVAGGAGVESAFVSPNAGIDLLLNNLALNYKSQLQTSDFGAGLPGGMMEGVGAIQFLTGDAKKIERGTLFSNAVDDVYKPVAELGGKAAHAAAMEVWTMQYMTMVTQKLAAEKVPGFEEIYDTSTGRIVAPGKPADMLPREFAAFLREKGENMVKSGAAQNPDELFKIFFRELSAPENVQQYEAQFLTAADPMRAAIFALVYNNNQTQIFERKLLGLRDYYFTDPNGPAAVGAANAKAAEQGPLGFGSRPAPAGPASFGETVARLLAITPGM